MEFRKRVQRDIETLLGAAEDLKIEGVWDPTRVITRYPHATHVTPLQARRMAALGIFAEISFESDFEVGTYAQHALPSLLYYGTPVLVVRNLIVANSSFEQQYARAYALIESTLSGDMPIRIEVVDAIRDGAMRGAPVEGDRG